MKLSVIIPVYNVYRYLSECVSSALKIGHDTEVILVDDGSTDGSGALCDELAAEDTRIKVIHQQNGGLSCARNTGIKNATGDYIMLLDSDDFISAEEVDKMLEAFGGSAEILMGLYNKYYTEEDLYEKESCDAFLKINGLVTADEFLAAIPKSGTSCYMTAWRFVISREFIINNGLFFFEGIYHEDEEWTQRLLTCAKNFFVTHQFFYQYRQARSGSIMATVKPKNIFDAFTIMDRAEKLYKALPDTSQKKQYLGYRIAQLYISNIINLYVLNKEEWAAAIKKLKEYKNKCRPYFKGIIGISINIFQTVLGIEFTAFCLKNFKRITSKGAEND